MKRKQIRISFTNLELEMTHGHGVVAVHTHNTHSLITKHKSSKSQLHYYISRFTNMVETLLGPTFRYTLPIPFPTSNRILLSSPMSSSFPIPSSPNRNHRRCYSNPNPNPNLPQPQPALLVFSGGTAFNG